MLLRPYVYYQRSLEYAYINLRGRLKARHAIRATAWYTGSAAFYKSYGCGVTSPADPEPGDEMVEYLST
jgi:hypothetical protein